MRFARSRILNKYITIYRMVAIDGTIKTERQQVAENIKCAIIPFDDSDTSQTEQAQGQEYTIYLPITADIKTGDAVVDQSKNTYQIEGVNRLDYGYSSRNHHIRAVGILQKEVEAL